MRIINYFRTGIWQARLEERSPVRRFLLRYLRMFVLAVRGFQADNSSMQASALTFYTLLATVPVVTLVLAIARGFGLDAVVQRNVWASIGQQTELIERIFGFADKLLKSTTNGVVAGVGVALLLWSVTSALGSIEFAFNRIWEVPQSRRVVRRVTDYIALLVVGTVLWIVSLGIGVTLQSQAGSLAQRLGIPNLSLFTVLLLQAARFLMVWLLFAAAYTIIPNTRVRLASGIFGAFWGTVIYHVVEWVYLRFQIGVASYGAVYGGFAAVPLFLAWVQTTWMVVLFGAELAFSAENAETYGFSSDYTKLSGHARRLLHLRIVHLLVRSFEQGAGALTVRNISRQAQIPVRLLRRLLRDLVDAGLVTRTLESDERRVRFQPARSSAQLTLGYAIDALDGYAPEGEKTGGDLPQALQRLHDAVAQSEANVRVAELPFTDRDGQAPA